MGCFFSLSFSFQPCDINGHRYIYAENQDYKNRCGKGSHQNTLTLIHEKMDGRSTEGYR
ncbi:hypothetical protein ATG71_4243 [Bacillus sp. es.034]|nr:hypothetical protein ATG71_4243 [Bacillus sp. es.034]